MKILISRRAEKQLADLGKASRVIVDKRIRSLDSETSLYQEKKLSGYKNYFRTRVGDYRIVYKKTPAETFIVLIGHRKEIYRLLKDLL